MKTQREIKADQFVEESEYDSDISRYMFLKGWDAAVSSSGARLIGVDRICPTCLGMGIGDSSKGQEINCEKCGGSGMIKSCPTKKVNTLLD